jgi:hypothetical protein
VSPLTGQVLFPNEYAAELESWLRRRFVYLCAACAALALLNLTFALWVAGGPQPSDVLLRLAGLAAGESVGWLAIVGVHYGRRGRALTREDLLRAATRMILMLGAVSLVTRLAAPLMAVRFPGSMLVVIFLWHLTACLFLPWPPRESLRPILPLLAVWGLHTLVAGEGGIAARTLAVMFSPGILLPGLAVCGWRLRRHGRRFSFAMLGQQLGTLRQELGRARGIHESLFPAPYDDGYVRVGYAYEPMRELGGDFLHVHGSPGGLVHTALIDVTGHGLAAALTVNRLYGELERIRAESPDAAPAAVLGLLNRYIGLTMARHNIFATAAVVTLDPYLGRLLWASAGHPPLLLRGANRAVRDLPSTGLMLGAVLDEDYDVEQHSVELSPGDVILLFTDGAYEARNRAGLQLGLRRLRELLEEAPPADGWPQALWRGVGAHRAGRTEDDILIAAMTFLSYRTKTSIARRVLMSA